MSPKFFIPLHPQKLKWWVFKIWGHTEPCPPYTTTPQNLWGMLDECIRPTQYLNAIDPQVIYNQENLKLVKIHFLQQKNPNFFVK